MRCMVGVVMDPLSLIPPLVSPSLLPPPLHFLSLLPPPFTMSQGGGRIQEYVSALPYHGNGIYGYVLARPA